MESIKELREKLRLAEEKEKAELLAIARRRSQCVHPKITENEDRTLHQCAECGEQFTSVTPNQTTDADRVTTLSREIIHQQEQINWHNKKKEELQQSLLLSRDLRKEICLHLETRQRYRTTIREYTPGYGSDCQLIGQKEL